MAVYPLGVPLLASPQAIVAVTIASTSMRSGDRGDLWLALAIVLSANAAIMFGLALLGGGSKARNKDSFSLAPVLLRVVALLLCALAIEIMALGLRGYGLMPPMPTQAAAGSGAVAH
jgi:multiple antibiotic resistance protein